MFEAIWNGHVLARGSDVIEVEGRIYFRPGDVDQACLRAAPDRSVCEWKGGEADYFDVVVGDACLRAAAWRYRTLRGHARPIEARIAFWKDVAVRWAGAGQAPVAPQIAAAMPNVAKALGAHTVVWRPTGLPMLAGLDEAGEFAGYLIPDLGVLVDVCETPPADEIPARIAAARARGEAVSRWNAAHPGERHGYIAVWGSATPAAAALDELRRGGVVLALTDPATVLSV